jgi:hypothetical protein
LAFLLGRLKAQGLEMLTSHYKEDFALYSSPSALYLFFNASGSI